MDHSPDPALRAQPRASDGLETWIRYLIRRRALQVEKVRAGDRTLRVPTLAKILRIKAWPCLMRKATRDHLDFAALAGRIGEVEAARIVAFLDDDHEDQLGPGGRRVATQVARQPAPPRPGDLTDIDLLSHRGPDHRWRDWKSVADACARVAVRVLDESAGEPE